MQSFKKPFINFENVYYIFWLKQNYHFQWYIFCSSSTPYSFVKKIYKSEFKKRKWANFVHCFFFFIPLILEFTFDPVILQIQLWFFLFKCFILIQNLFNDWNENVLLIFLFFIKYPIPIPIIPFTCYSLKCSGKLIHSHEKKSPTKKNSTTIEWQSKGRLTKQNVDIE